MAIDLASSSGGLGTPVPRSLLHIVSLSREGYRYRANTSGYSERERTVLESTVPVVWYPLGGSLSRSCS
jgi:hypothetical protein